MCHCSFPWQRQHENPAQLQRFRTFASHLHVSRATGSIWLWQQQGDWHGPVQFSCPSCLSPLTMPGGRSSAHSLLLSLCSPHSVLSHNCSRLNVILLLVAVLKTDLFHKSNCSFYHLLFCFFHLQTFFSPRRHFPTLSISTISLKEAATVCLSFHVWIRVTFSPYLELNKGLSIHFFHRQTQLLVNTCENTGHTENHAHSYLQSIIRSYCAGSNALKYAHIACLYFFQVKIPSLF